MLRKEQSSQSGEFNTVQRATFYNYNLHDAARLLIFNMKIMYDMHKTTD